MNDKQINAKKITQGFKNLLILNESIQQQMSVICEPLEQLGIKYFYYLKFYKNGNILYLENKPTLLNYVIKNNLTLKQYNSFVKEIKKLLQKDFQHSKCIFWKEFPQEEVHEVLNKLNIGNIITFCNKTDVYLEAYGFGSKKDNNDVLDFYINNLDIFNRFFCYFKAIISSLIKLDDEEKLLACNPIEKENIIINFPCAETIKIKNFLEKTTPKVYYLKNGTRLGIREAECLAYLSRGYSVKETAKILRLSPRTVESYLNAIKTKAQCYTTSELRDLFFNSDLNDLISYSFPNNA